VVLDDSASIRAARPSHHKPGGGFRNPWWADEPRGFGSVALWMAQRLGRRLAGRTPPEPSSAGVPRGVPRIERPRATGQRLVATWVGHSTFLVQMGRLNILTDPMWGARASPVSFAGPRRLRPPGVSLDALPPIDVVLQSHNHYDHLDRGSVEWIAHHHPTARWFVPLGVAELVTQFGVSNVTELDWWETAVVDDCEIACAPARHFSARGIRDRDATLWCGWCVRSLHRRVFFAGDTGLHPEFAAIAQRFGPFDLVMLPIGAYEPRWFMKPVHMSPEEASEACLVMRAVQPFGYRSVMAAMHWGTFKLTDEPVDEPPKRLTADWSRRALPVDDLWIPAPGETREILSSGVG
jgi:N-acyl-phosphatidylethanolamine-hydrolysing phospholipase D